MQVLSSNFLAQAVHILFSTIGAHRSGNGLIATGRCQTELNHFMKIVKSDGLLDDNVSLYIPAGTGELQGYQI